MHALACCVKSYKGLHTELPQILKYRQRIRTRVCHFLSKSFMENIIMKLHYYDEIECPMMEQQIRYSIQLLKKTT